MKPKYQLGQIVENRNTGQKLTIKDFEIFDDLVLYYLQEGGALPEAQVSVYGLTGVKTIFSTSDEEKNQQIQNVLSTLDQDLNNILGNA